jgi:hypothetical protein
MANLPTDTTTKAAPFVPNVQQLSVYFTDPQWIIS